VLVDLPVHRENHGVVSGDEVAALARRAGLAEHPEPDGKPIRRTADVDRQSVPFVGLAEGMVLAAVRKVTVQPGRQRGAFAQLRGVLAIVSNFCQTFWCEK
jgi:hypothetical protein